MKARIIKPKSLEKQKKHYLDMFNDLVMNKSENASLTHQLSSMSSSSGSLLPSSLGFGVALLTGGAFQQFVQTKRGETSTDLPFHQAFGVSSTLSSNQNWMGTVTPEAIKIPDSQAGVNTMKTSSQDTSYLPTTKLDKETYGALSERNVAIYKKICTDKRIIQTEDLKVVDGITKAQNTGAFALMMSSGTIFWSTRCSLSTNAKMRVFQLGFVGFLTSIGALSHYNWQFTKFMQHVNEKYFYATGIKELQNEAIIKSNRPRNISFPTGGSWSFKNKLPDMKAWYNNLK